MGFRNGCFATVWKNRDGELVKLSEKYADIRLSTSKKNAQGTYENDFGGKVRFIGKAFEKLKSTELNEKDVLHLLEVETQSRWDKNAQKDYISYICWDFETNKKLKPQKVEVVDEPNLEPFPDDDLPF